MRQVILLILSIVCFATMSSASTQWPHDFTSPTALLDWPFNQCTGNGITQVGNGCVIVSDSSTTTQGTLSPTNVAQASWAGPVPQGSGGGVQMDYAISPHVNEVFIGMWIKFSYPGSTNLYNKFQYIKNDICNCFFGFYGSAGNSNGKVLIFHMQGFYSSTGGGNNCQLDPAITVLSDPGICQIVTGNASSGQIFFNDGIWHKIEMHLKASTTSISQNGVLQSWIDGVAVHNISNLNLGPGGFYLAEWTQTWDGQQDFDHTGTWQEFVDHWYISLNSGGSPPPDTTPPSAPTGLTVQ